MLYLAAPPDALCLPKSVRETLNLNRKLSVLGNGMAHAESVSPQIIKQHWLTFFFYPDQIPY